MKKFGLATIAASGLAAAILGFAAPAQPAPTTAPTGVEFSADIEHHRWIHDIQPKVNVPQVDTSVRTR